MGVMHDEAIKGLLENLQRQEQQQPQQPEQQPEPDHPQIQVPSYFNFTYSRVPNIHCVAIEFCNAVNSQYFFTKILEIGPWVSRIN